MIRCSKRIILGSASPRRRELLAGLDYEFTTDTGNGFIEIVPEGTGPRDVPGIMAEGKSKGFHRSLEDDEVLITADTVVIVGSTVLGKPHSRDEAVRMLKLLSNRTHEVVTSVCIRDNAKTVTFSDTSYVSFKELSDSEIDYYIDNYQPYDKAGAYGIQEWIGYIGITRIDGSFFNVMGLPVQRLRQELLSFL